MGIYLKLGLFLFCYTGYLSGEPADIPPSEKLAADFCPESAHCSFSVRDVKSGREILAHHPETNSTPASVQKILVAYLALKHFGPQKHFETSVEIQGSVEGGRLEGNVVLNSSGDPAFGSDFFGREFSAEAVSQNIIQRIKEKGIKSIDGCLDVKEGSTPGPNPYALYEDVGNYYGASAGGFMYRDNRFNLYLEGDKRPGVSLKFLRTEPEKLGISNFNIFAKTSVVGSRDEAYIFPGKLGGVWEVRGSYPAGEKKFFIKGALPSPKLAFVEELREQINKNGIIVKESPCRQISSVRTRKIYTQRSPDLKKILRHTLVKSDNVYAEQLLNLVAEEKLNSQNPMYSGEKLTMLLKKENLKMEGELFDASGLSPLNYLSAQNFTLILKKIVSSPEGPLFMECMLGSAKKDVGKTRAFHKDLGNKLLIKTGYMKSVSSAGGILKTNSGKRLAFYFALNNTRRPPDFRGRLGKILAQIAKNY